MTRKDYEKFAQVFADQKIVGEPSAFTQTRNSYLAGARQQAKFLAEEMCSIFAADNPRFDKARFLKACGIEY